MDKSMKRKITRIVLGVAALAVVTGCYPIDPTPQECLREQYPPHCGCPKPGGGFYGDDPGDICN